MIRKSEHRSVTLFWILVLTVFVLISGFTAVRFAITKKRLDEALAERAEIVALRIVDAISPTIWDNYRRSDNREYSQEVTSAILDSEFRDPFVLGVVVYGNFGHVHMARFRGTEGLLGYDESVEREIRTKADLDFYEPVKNGPMTIGNVRVFLSAKPHLDLIRQTLIVDVVEALCVSVLIVACLFFILRKSLIEPMRKLSIASHVIESLGEAVIVTDRKGFVVNVNSFFCQLFEQTRTGVLGNRLGLKVESGPGADILDSIWRGKATDRSWAGEVRVSADGIRWKEVYANVSPVVSENGESDYTVAVLLGIEELKKAEAALILQNRELETAKDRAEASSRAKDEFLSIMSHELRTPLNPILGFGNLIRDSLKNPDLQQQMDVVLNSATHLLRLIESILEYTKLERDRSQCETRAFDYRLSCERALEVVRLEADKKSLELRLQHEHCDELYGRGGRFDVLCDQTKFEQILLNFVVNAVKFTNEGSVSIETRLSTDRLRISVIDTGIGIPADSVETVFQAFTQVDSSLSRKHEGIGLGLAISRKLADVLSGQIGCESELGKGTVFWLEIPVEVSSSNRLPQAGEEERAIGGFAANGRRVLIVEDDEENLHLAQMQLAKLGYRVSSARSGSEALEQADAVRADVILMDLQMEGMDGFSTTDQIRRSSLLNRETPVVAFTAHASAITKQECLDRGMSDFIAKPYTLPSLEEKLERWSGRKVED